MEDGRRRGAGDGQLRVQLHDDNNGGENGCDNDDDKRPTTTTTATAVATVTMTCRVHAGAGVPREHDDGVELLPRRETADLSLRSIITRRDDDGAYCTLQIGGRRQPVSE
jgi:hypothetical protein